MKKIIFGILISIAACVFLLPGARAQTMLIPDSVTRIEEEAFAQNTGVSVLVLNERVAMSSHAFMDCENLSVLVFKGNIEFPYDAFEGCPLDAVYCDENTYAHTFALEKGLTVYPVEAFYDEWDYAFTVLKNGTARITAYKGMESIVSVPEYVRGIRVTEIGENAFKGNRAITELSLPESVQSIGSGAFTDCAFLRSINIPSSVIRIGDNPFVNCSALKKLDLSAGNSMFSVENGVLLSRTQKRVIYFSCSSEITEVTLPDGIEVIGKNAFRRAASLKKVVFPASLKRIEAYAFFECCRLRTAQLPGNLIEIGAYAFTDCRNLSGIVFPSALEKAGDYAFKNCGYLKNSVLPENTVAGEGVFLNDAKVSGTVMSILPLYQFDYRKTVCVFYGEEKSVATSGCGATCVSMAIRFLKNNFEQTPETLFEWTYNNGYYTGDGLSHAALSRLCSNYGISAAWTSSASEVLSALKNGRPVIAHMGAGTFAESGHYILLRGVDDNGLILLNDPNSRERTLAAYSLAKIQAELKFDKGFCILK